MSLRRTAPAKGVAHRAPAAQAPGPLGSGGAAAVRPRPPVLLFSCEHGGCRVPPAYAALFAGQAALLQSHRGWDRGALPLARQLAAAFGAPLHAATLTRLLIDLNRSISHPHLFSEFTRPLPPAQRRLIIERFYRPHREAVAAAVAWHISAGRQVIHIALHSFTPVLDGQRRQADLAWLYDPRRPSEKAWAGAWLQACASAAPSPLRLRRNYPYQGRSDGLVAWLRQCHADACYVGIELEVNQRFAERGGPAWQAVRRLLVATLASLLPVAAKMSSASA